MDTDDPNVKEKVYELYVEAYKKGLYNYIKSDFDPIEHKPIKRRYYSGGFSATNINKIISSSPLNTLPNQKLLTGPTIEAGEPKQ